VYFVSAVRYALGILVKLSVPPHVVVAVLHEAPEDEEIGGSFSSSSVEQETNNKVTLRTLKKIMFAKFDLLIMAPP
jgi:hypothetical protein